MESIENIGEEYQNYWETKMFLQNEEFDRYTFSMHGSCFFFVLSLD
jgi:hypothetical protein